MYTVKMTSDSKFSEAWNDIVKEIGGKRIRKLTITSDLKENVSDDGNFINLDSPVISIFEDAILLKDDNINFYTYKINDRCEIFIADMDSIEWLNITKISPKQYRLSILEYIGLYWTLEIELR